ncbi:ImmA/IrrE family metallo-endopeptidase [Brevibacillus ruminantium]|uniref:ImmA/IrrE family metallo-endopeptidase n=1 Tax=Brevibacillus ruminantium TaxID=2950604 RepID=A0ABY4WC67_9BACL|nr:ImmA/IrrE family metallo-endopeptidase [Brevibacillus ruminantium]USG64653.1 ImmA/IrrE family metallo-endopeptidase [Brevibacillus ruminantium]
MFSLVVDALQPQTWLESRVYQLLELHDIRQPEDIQLTELCLAYGIELWDIDGRSRAHPHPFLPDRFVIAVDQRLSVPERREKIAHELGHLLLHEGIQPWSGETMIGMQEAQANHFAEHLLLPYPMFVPLLDHCTRYEAPSLLASAFRVPLSLAQKRFDRLLGRMYAKGHPVIW